MKNCILLVEDEPKLANVIRKYLEASNLDCHWDADGHSAIKSAREFQPRLIILDLNLPDIDGINVCQQIRQFSDIPILMLTARSDEINKISGLDAGADDYVTKPFSPNELMARVRAMLRRSSFSPATAHDGLTLNKDTYVAAIDGNNLNLTPMEFKLLSIMHSSPGRVYSRNQLLDQCHDDYRDTTDRAIDSHIRNLRNKLSKAQPDNEYIRSVYGMGYKFEI